MRKYLVGFIMAFFMVMMNLYAYNTNPIVGSPWTTTTNAATARTGLQVYSTTQVDALIATNTAGSNTVSETYVLNNISYTNTANLITTTNLIMAATNGLVSGANLSSSNYASLTVSTNIANSIAAAQLTSSNLVSLPQLVSSNLVSLPQLVSSNLVSLPQLVSSNYASLTVSTNIAAAQLTSSNLVSLPQLVSSNYFHVAGTNLNSSNGTISLNQNVTNINYLQFLADGGATYGLGKVFYDTTDNTLCYYGDQSSVTINIGQEEHVRIVNKTGSVISNGYAVTINNVLGNRPTGILAVSTNIDLPYWSCVGVSTMDIPVNAEGLITTFGIVHGIDTRPYGDGKVLYLSTTNGLLTTNRPPNLYNVVTVGLSLNSTPNGSILVSPIQPTHMNDVTGLITFLTGQSNSLYSQLSLRQQGSQNLTNWSQLSTNAITGLLTNIILTAGNANITIVSNAPNSYTLSAAAGGGGTSYINTTEAAGVVTVGGIGTNLTQYAYVTNLPSISAGTSISITTNVTGGRTNYTITYSGGSGGGGISPTNSIIQDAVPVATGSDSKWIPRTTVDSVNKKFIRRDHLEIGNGVTTNIFHIELGSYENFRNDTRFSVELKIHAYFTTGGSTSSYLVNKIIALNAETSTYDYNTQEPEIVFDGASTTGGNVSGTVSVTDNGSGDYYIYMNFSDDASNSNWQVDVIATVISDLGPSGGSAITSYLGGSW